MKASESIRTWLDRYQERLRVLLSDYGYGCLYVEDISSASGITWHRAEKYSSDEGVLFQESDFEVVVAKIIEAVEDVLKNHLEEGNRICFTILHGGSVGGGFGIWVVKEKSEFLERILEGDKPYLIGLLNR